MRTIHFAGLVALALSVAACEKGADNNAAIENNVRSYDAVMEPIGDDTRSSVTLAGEFSWEEGDGIAVVGDDAAIEQSSISAVNNGVGTFTTAVENPRYATYPQIAKTYNEGTLTVELPASYGTGTTAHSESTNAAMLAMMTASGEQATDEVTFNHLGAVLRISVKDIPAGATKLVFATDKRITGEFTVENQDGNEPRISTDGAADGTTVTFEFAATAGVANMLFHIPLPVGTYNKFDIYLYGTGSEEPIFKKETSQDANIEVLRRKLLILPDLYTREHSFVDLGNGQLWATENIGAATATDYGNYFSWGDPETPKPNGVHNAYTYIMGIVENGIYTGNSKYNASDALTRLQPQDDVATIYWGPDWRMPTKEEAQWLVANCTWEWKANYNESGINGCLVTSKVDGYTDRFIFLPAAGYHYLGNTYGSISTVCDYWSADIATDDKNAYDYTFSKSENYVKMAESERFTGLPVRPVRVND